MPDPAGTPPDASPTADRPGAAAPPRPERSGDGSATGGGTPDGRGTGGGRSQRAGRWIAAVAAVLLLTVAGGAALLALRAAPGDPDPTVASRLGPGPHLVFAEFGPAEDTLYIAPAAEPGRRTALARVPHTDGWGIHPGAEMAGPLLAYTVLPVGAAGRRDTPAELWVLNVETRNLTRLARDADLLVAPLVDGDSVVYRTSTAGGRQELVRVDLDTRARTTLHTYEGGFGILPVALPDGETVIFATYSTAGTDLYRLRDGSAPRLLAHASDEIARDFRLSPDREALAYVAPVAIAERYLHRLHVIDATSGEPRAPLPATDPASADGGEEFSPAWTPGGAPTVGREAAAGPAAAAVVGASHAGGAAAGPLTPPQTGFDVPLGWSADGRYLAVRSFSGSGAYDPGAETMVVVDTDGGRTLLPTRTELSFLGWYRGA